MLELKDFMPINFLKKEMFTGSYKGMRFRMEKAQEQDTDVLAVTVWPEPYGYDATPEEQKERILLSFDSDGIAKGVDWLNEKYQEKQDFWSRTPGTAGRI